MIDWIVQTPPPVAQARLDLARIAIDRRPDQFSLWVTMGSALVAVGDIDGAEHHWRAAIPMFPDDPLPSLKLAEIQYRLTDFKGTLATLDARVELAEVADAVLLKLNTLTKLGRWDTAAALVDAVQRTHPDAPSLIHLLAELHKTEPEILLAECDAVLRTHPGSANALHHRAASLAMLGRIDEARATTGFDDFVSIGGIGVLPEIAGDPFDRALRAEILANDTLQPDPRGTATRSGLQTAALLRPRDAATPALHDAIRAAVDVYAAALTGDHWFVRGRPTSAWLDAWAVVYADGGTQAPHRHPSGWASGVYYVGGAATSAAGAGPLLIGTFGANGDPMGETIEIAPLPGRLVIFPSATTHATAPSRPGAARISVAFDVIDRSASA